MKLKLKSARQQIKENEAARDAQFLKDYPDGRYALKADPAVGRYGKSFTLYWKAARRPHCKQDRCVRTWKYSPAEGAEGAPVIILRDGYWNSLRYSEGGTYIKFFASLDACLSAARKRKFPEPLIQAFIEELNRRTPEAPLKTKQPVQQGERANE